MTPQDKPVTRKEFDKLSPRSQGYVCYMQAAWNKQIPKKCPYGKGTRAYDEWSRGEFDGVLEAQDCDD